jgi:hypothetical protein
MTVFHNSIISKASLQWIQYYRLLHIQRALVAKKDIFLMFLAVTAWNNLYRVYKMSIRKL